KVELQEAAGHGDEARQKLLADVVKGLVKHAPRSNSERGLKAMLYIARSEDGMSADADRLDASTRILNTSSGIVDLDTGQLRRHDPAALCTRITAAPFEPDAGAPFWQMFLRTI